MDAVTSLKRSNMHLNRAVRFRSRKSTNHLGGSREIKISLKGIKSRHIIAYHLEVWGKTRLSKPKTG